MEINKDSLMNELKDAVEIVKLNKPKMSEVAKRPHATKMAVIFLVVPFVVTLILAILSFPSGFGSIFSGFLLWPIFIPIVSIVAMIFCMSIVSKKFFKGVGNDLEFFRTLSYPAAAILALNVVPFLLMLLIGFNAYSLANLINICAMAWTLVVSYYFLPEHHKTNQQDTIIVVVIGVLTYFVVAYLLGMVLMQGTYRMM